MYVLECKKQNDSNVLLAL